MRRTRLSLAALVVASSAVLGLPTAALADTAPAPAAAAPSVEPTSADPAVTPTAEPSESTPVATPEATTDETVTEGPADQAAPAATAPLAADAAPLAVDAAPQAAAEQAVTAAAVPAGDRAVQILAMNDFHGRISETTGSDSQLLTAPGPDGIYGPNPALNNVNDDVNTVVGGAANIASTVKAQRASYLAANSGATAASSLFVGAGDLISASPFNSSVFKDEPTIEVLNAMGLNASSVGNHEFDRGTQELRRISAKTDRLYSDDVSACQGVTAGVDGCFTDSLGRPFQGAQFDYLAANVVMKDTGAPMLPPYQVFDVGGGQKVALIGVVTDTTPTIVSPTGIADVRFIDEATAINQWVPTIQAMGIQSIGVLIHEGGSAGNAALPAAAYDGCSGLTGPILDINAKTSSAVDFIVSAHTHQAYNCLLSDPAGRPRLVTQAGYYGRLVTDIRLAINTTTGDVDRAAGAYTAANVPVTRAAADPTVAAIVAYWDGKAKTAGSVVVGEATADILRSSSPTTSAPRDVESSLGNLVAQAQLEGVQNDVHGRPVIAFMNPGGLRTDLLAGPVTYSELFDIQPFSNTVNTITLTGADIRQVLEQQFQKDQARGTQLILGTSVGFSYSYDLARAYGDRVDPCSITLNGTAIDPAATYRVAANSFLVAGGDSFAAFTKGTGPVTGPVDVDTSVAYFTAHSPVSPPAADHGKPSTTRLTCGAGLPPTPNPAPVGGSGNAGAGAPGGAVPSRPVVGGLRGTTATGARSASLAYTGSPLTDMLAVGGLLTVAGVVLTAAGYRRRRGLAD